MGDPEIEQIGLGGLRYRCQQESELFFQRQKFDPRYCFEIFRRAFVLRSEEAWECVYRQYHDLVLAWITRHQLAGTLDEEAGYFLNRAFEKMWLVITPQKFAEFPDLKSLLRYLQMCVHSVIIDHSRARERAMLMEDDSEPENLLFQEDQPHEDGVEKQVAGRLYAREMWEQVSRRLKNEQERAVMVGMVVLNLKSREVLETFQGVFENIDEIYMVKENLFSRLRRDRDLLQVLSSLEGVGHDDGAHGVPGEAKSESAREKAQRAGKISSGLV
jgi:DNA-directed RNA polymerase specialized sigma24 family protein